MIWDGSFFAAFFLGKREGIQLRVSCIWYRANVNLLRTDFGNGLLRMLTNLTITWDVD